VSEVQAAVGNVHRAQVDPGGGDFFIWLISNPANAKFFWYIATCNRLRTSLMLWITTGDGEPTSEQAAEILDFLKKKGASS
jgi:hypothetical protein